MKIEVVGKNISVTPAIKAYAENKIGKLDKYFADDHVSARVLVRTYNVGTKAEVTVSGKNVDLRAEVKNDDLYAALDLVVDKLEGQVRKIKTIYKNRRKEKLAELFNFEVEDEEPVNNDVVTQEGDLVRNKIFNVSPMSLDDAIFNMEALGHLFFMYIDSSDNEKYVVYRRDDGGYGRIGVER